MQTRRPLFGVTVGLLVFLSPALRAESLARTPNFIIHAPDERLAQQFGQMAEQYRRQKAVEWLGQEMPPWPRPCPLYVKPRAGGAGGATKFNYDFRGGYEVLSMEIEGEVQKMLHSVLPHEITHTVFAHYFRYPVPRWADEGGSVLSEDEQEHRSHDHICRTKLNHHQAIPLRRLFTLKEYGEVSDVMVIYAQGFSVSHYLVSLNGRQSFLGFVAMGLRGEWDKAAQQYYQFQSVEALEQAWLLQLRESKVNGTAISARNTNHQPRGDLTSRTQVRQTAPPAQPQLDPAGPVVRGQSDEAPQRAATTAGRPAYLPDAQETAAVPPLKLPAPPAARQAPAVPPLPPVRLGVPQFSPGPAPAPVSSPGVGTAVGRGN